MFSLTFMKRKILPVVVTLIILLGLGYYSYTVYKSPEKEPPQTVLPEEAPKAETIWASGTVVPSRRAELSFAIGGKVVEIAVREGDVVEEGQLLARLDDAELQAAVAQAKAQVQAAEAKLAHLKAGPRPEELAAAEAAVQEAEAALETARAQLAAAQAELRRLEAGPSEEEIAAAEAELKQAEAVLQQAQAEYDKIAWAPNAAASPQAVALEQATAAYEAAKARYEALLKGVSEEELDAARARVRAAYAQVRLAEARLSQAQAQYELLKAGATEEEIAAAEAEVAQAEAALAQARAALEKAYLYAPFKGVVGKVWLREGEMASLGQPVISLGDLATFQVETTDLRETDVVKIYEGQRVELTFDALPNLVLPGHIVRIAPRASYEEGSTNYTVIVAFDQTDPRLRWGMTAYVNIEVSK
ncbi:MAG TPA: HlyD family efflux transporter periplasmic adaptor subunit [Chloroflexi bacterium]|nr:HlyD family efflux transporter periplasmic adaptor subunit [Chloroflexota bacterium]